MNLQFRRISCASVMAALLCGNFPQSVSARPEVVLPATQSGQFIREWLKQCQAPNVEQMTKWLTINFSDKAAKRVGGIGQVTTQNSAEICNTNGGFRIDAVHDSNLSRVSLVVVGSKSDIWFDLTLATDTAGKIAGLYIQPTTPAESSLPKDLSDASIGREVRHTVVRLDEEGLFSGIVVVARGSKAIVSTSAGYANWTSHSAITGSTQFTLGSLGKMFTATAIGQLVDRHKLSFDDTVGKFFPEYPNKTVRDKVTVGMLLSHTDGLGDFLRKRTPEMMQNGVKRASEFMPLYDEDEPQFEPGTQWAYSNAGLALAGAIVEKASGEDYPDYIRRHVFAVAGMTRSDPNNIPHRSDQMVTPYTKMTKTGPSPDWREAPYDIGSPAGGALSSADDLVRFADALRSGQLVSKATFEEMTKTHGPMPPGFKYGYAMGIEDVYGRTFVGHNGGFPGVSTHLYMLLDSPYTVVVLSNQDPPAEAYAGSQIAALIVEKAKVGK